jgi:hypothetical protein
LTIIFLTALLSITYPLPTAPSMLALSALAPPFRAYLSRIAMGKSLLSDKQRSINIDGV